MCIRKSDKIKNQTNTPHSYQFHTKFKKIKIYEDFNNYNSWTQHKSIQKKGAKINKYKVIKFTFKFKDKHKSHRERRERGKEGIDIAFCSCTNAQ